ncbi:MAG: hypothetical protein DRG69_09755 [Deltaproteobacteria bacterium]|nr:MAG: hypothetical protein DRG69_09755 [Deltaproteobacteria bacterium]
MKETNKTYFFFNNCPRGQALTNALVFKRFVGLLEELNAAQEFALNNPGTPFRDPPFTPRSEAIVVPPWRPDLVKPMPNTRTVFLRGSRRWGPTRGFPSRTTPTMRSCWSTSSLRSPRGCTQCTARESSRSSSNSRG